MSDLSHASAHSTWQALGGDTGRPSRDTTPPNLPYGHIPRPRLVAMIEKPFRARVTLIIAGAGYGKTILATELAVLGDVQTAWLSLSASDNDEHTLIEDLRIALRPCLRRGRLMPPPDMTDDHDLLERDLADVEQGNCLILDNCEALTNPACHQVLSDVIARLPDGCLIVLVGRTAPPIPLGKLHASGMVREIGSAHLRFTRTETSAFFTGLPDVRLEPDELLRVHPFTEGWAVGLYLVSLAARTHAMTLVSGSDRDQVLHQFIDEYIQQEVLAPLSEASRALILTMIELPRVTIDLCTRVLGITAARDRMDALVREFPFVSVLPGTSPTWAWARMIRESLLRITDAALKRRPTGDLPRAIAAALLREGALQDAADYALIGGEPEWIAESIRPWCESLALRSDFEPLGTLIERLPAEVFTVYPEFSYWRAISHLGIGRHLSLSDWFPAIERAWMDSEDPLLIGWALTIRAMAAWQGGDNAESAIAADAAREVLPSTATTARMYAASTKARALFRTGDDAGSTTAAKEAEHLAAVLPLDEQWAWRMLAMDRANAYAIRGDLQSAITKYRLIISELPESLKFLEGAYRSRLISLAIEQDHIDIARNEYAQVERLLEGEWRLWHIWAILAKSRLLIAEGDIDSAETWMATHVKTLRRMPGKMQLVMHLAQVWLHHGEYAMARSWLSDLDGLPYPIVDTFGGIDHRQIRVDLDLAEGRYATAAMLAQAMTEAAAATNRWSDFITFSTRWALATSLIGDLTKATAILAPAVTRGDRGGFVRAYRVPGFDTSGLLEGARHSIARKTPDLPSVISPQSLTPREFQVLHLVARGRSNHQIARELFISANTVRNHIAHICRRLDANSRMEAVAKARDLGLIS